MTTTKTRRLLLIDNYDSFTYNLYDYFLQLGTDCQVVRNDDYTLEEIQALDFDGLVLSPGPQRPEDAGLLMDILKFYAGRLPILGICLGHQAIGMLYGASLVKAPVPVHGKTASVIHQNHPLFATIPSPMQVMRYHSLIVQDLSNTDLEVIGQTENLVMALVHRELPIVGVQFHPESILTPMGMQLLQNWLNYYL